MLKNTYFIVGTDTNVGKTLLTCSLLNILSQKKVNAFAIKPVATGKIFQNNVWFNEDIQLIKQCNRLKIPEDKINFYSFHEFCSAHIAAAKKNKKISTNNIINKIKSLRKQYEGILFIETAGGILSPLNETESFLDIIKILQVPVILVVGLRLGCINQSLLTHFCLKQNNIQVVAWIANQVEQDMLYVKENIETLKRHLNFPLLATIPYLEGGGVDAITNFLSSGLTQNANCCVENVFEMLTY